VNQQFYSTLWDGYESDKAARQARDTEARRLRAAGHRVSCCVLRNQMRPYAGLGQPDGRSCSVFMLTDFGTDTAVA
jgi:hypothetical protein